MKWACADGIGRTRDDDGPIVVHGGRSQNVVDQLHEVRGKALCLVDDCYRVGRATEFLDLVLVVTATEDDTRAVGQDDITCVLLELQGDVELLGYVTESRPDDVLGRVSRQGDVGHEAVVVPTCLVQQLVG